MLPFTTDGFNYLVDDSRKYNKLQENFPARSTGPGPGPGPDHQIVSVPVSPSRNTVSGLHALIKSRLAWLILLLVVIVITLTYQAYEERMRQQRLLTYMDRVDELKASMEQVKHHIFAATIRLKEYRRYMFENNNSSVTT